MEHPLIGDLNELTAEELNSRISDLYRKLNIAIQSGNGHMCDQIRMALESYQSKYQQKLQETTKQHNFDDKIRIS
jgi:hypothetical protein